MEFLATVGAVERGFNEPVVIMFASCVRQKGLVTWAVKVGL